MSTFRRALLLPFVIASLVTVQWALIKVMKVHRLQPIKMESNSESASSAIAFPTATLNVLRNLKSDREITIIVRQINSLNKHLLPPFRQINFEFFSLSQSLFFQNGLVSRREYQELIHRVAGGSRGEYSEVMVRDEPILKAVVQEFNDRNLMDLRMSKSYLVTVDEGTGIHFDQYCVFRLWIPLTTSAIDNLCLGVGDITHLPITSGYNLDRIIWYQQMTMTAEDWIFLRAHSVPHYAANMGNRYITQRRLAITINLVSSIG